MKQISIKFHVLGTDIETPVDETTGVVVKEGVNIFVDSVDCHVGTDVVTMEAKASIDGINLVTIEGSVENAVLIALSEKARIIKDPKSITPFIATVDRIFSSVVKSLADSKVAVSLTNSKSGKVFTAIGVIPRAGKITVDSFTFLYK